MTGLELAQDYHDQFPFCDPGYTCEDQIASLANAFEQVRNEERKRCADMTQTALHKVSGKLDTITYELMAALKERP